MQRLQQGENPHKQQSVCPEPLRTIVEPVADDAPPSAADQTERRLKESYQMPQKIRSALEADGLLACRHMRAPGKPNQPFHERLCFGYNAVVHSSPSTVLVQQSTQGFQQLVIEHQASFTRKAKADLRGVGSVSCCSSIDGLDEVCLTTVKAGQTRIQRKELN